jgi:predicted regulator of Ras-like GTPase activity (Roadblock/LC7/MglB family)
MTGTSPEQLLRSLRDVQGVAGSFVTSADGELLWRDMPAYFPSETLSEVAPRAARIFESWSADSDDAECVVRFADHKLYLHRLADGMLCALLRADTHMPSMRTAVSLVSRHLGSAMASRAGKPAAPSPVAAVEAQPGKQARYWRGRRID